METIPIRLVDGVTDTDHIRGEPHAEITLVEYGDYECPFCRLAEPLVEGLETTLGAHIRVVFRHFPLTRFHPHAERAAEAAEAASEQGQFWQMHRQLFASQASLDDGSLRGYAATLGLDLPWFEKNLEDHVFRAQIHRSLEGGLRSGVRGTPTVFIDGIRYEPPLDLQLMLYAMLESQPHLGPEVQPITQNIRVPDMTRARSG
jgi:protein-disulfide isomerase